MASEILELTADAFQTEVLNSELPVLVDFWATWCAPCRMMAPIIDELATDFEGKVAFAKVNVDNEYDLANTYGVQSIPTLVFFKNGAEAGRIVGLRPKKEIAEFLNQD